jgi:hypothetical protein
MTLKYVVIPIVLFLILTFSFSSNAEIIVSPPVILNLVGGDSITENITVKWTGNKEIFCEISSNVLPDGEGINITYSQNNITLQPNVEYTIQMTINTSMLLAPNQYIIKTEFNAVTHQSGGGGGRTHKKTTQSEPDPEPPDEPDSNEEPDPEPPDEPDEEKPNNENNDETASTVEIPYYIFLIFLLVIVTIIVIIIDKRRKKKWKKK